MFSPTVNPKPSLLLKSIAEDNSWSCCWSAIDELELEVEEELEGEEELEEEARRALTILLHLPARSRERRLATNEGEKAFEEEQKQQEGIQ